MKDVDRIKSFEEPMWYQKIYDQCTFSRQTVDGIKQERHGIQEGKNSA